MQQVGNGSRQVGKTWPGSEVGVGLDGAAADEERDTFAGVVGAGGSRIVAMIRGDHENVARLEGGLNFG